MLEVGAFLAWLRKPLQKAVDWIMKLFRAHAENKLLRCEVERLREVERELQASRERVHELELEKQGWSGRIRPIDTIEEGKGVYTLGKSGHATRFTPLSGEVPIDIPAPAQQPSEDDED